MGLDEIIAMLYSRLSLASLDQKETIELTIKEGNDILNTLYCVDYITEED